MNKKRMFEAVKEDGKVKAVYINSSSLSIMQECQRKADFILNKGLIAESSVDQDFGTIVHKTMATWYSLPPAERTKESITAIWGTEFGNAKYTPKDNRKTGPNGLIAMQKYADLFSSESYVVMEHEGKPMVEFEFEQKIITLSGVDYYLFGTMDLVLQDAGTGKVFTMDHKTATTLGQEFMDRWKPNHQMSGYIWALQQMGYDCDTAIINGIQVVITKQEILRVPTNRTVSEIDEFLATVVYEAQRFVTNTNIGILPGASDYACTFMGGCKFLGLCQTEPKQRGAAVTAWITERNAKNESI